MSAKEKNKLKKIATTLLKLGATVIAIWWVVSNISLKEVMGVFSNANYFYLAPAMLFLILSYFFQAIRQNLSLKITGASISQILNLKLFWLGMFYNLFLPGGIGGDGYKIYIINKYRKNGLKNNIGAMLVNRISGIVAVGMMSIGLYYLSDINIPYAWLSWIGIPAIYGLYMLVMKYFFSLFYKIRWRLFLWSVLLQMMQFFCVVFILKSFQLESGYFDYLFIFFVSTVATALPITLGGFGARELVIWLGSEYLTLNTEIAIAMSLMFYILTACVSVVGMYWVFFPPFRKETEPVTINDLKTEQLAT